MKGLLLLLVVAAVLLPPRAAEAQRWGGFGAQSPMQGQPMKKGPPGGQFQRGDRDRPGPDKGSQGRLTQEERRDLHRDLDRANREIYRRH